MKLKPFLCGAAALTLALGCSKKDEKPAVGPMTLIILDDVGNPVADLTVAFHDPKGNVSSVETTNANGTVNPTITEGASVSIPVDTAELITMGGLRPSDVITVQDPGGGTTPALLGTVDITLPGAVAGAVNYIADNGCGETQTGNPATVLTLDVEDVCVTQGGTFHLLVSAINSSDQIIEFTHEVEIAAPTAGGTVAQTMGAWRTDFDSLVVNFTNAPTTAFAAGMFEPALTMDGIRFRLNSDNFGVFTGGTTGFSLNIPPAMQGMDAGFAALYGSGLTSPPDSLVISFRKTTSGVPTQVDVDVAADLPPRVSAFAVDLADPNRPIATFTADGSLAGNDVVIYQLDTGTGSWSYFGPPGATSFQFPALPDELAAYRPNATTTDTVELIVANTDWIAGYDDLRLNHGVGFLSDLQGAPSNPDGSDSTVNALLASTGDLLN